MKEEKNFADFFKEIEKADSSGASFDELSGRMEDFMREAIKNECPEKLAEFDALQKEADEFAENERANRGKTRKKKHNYSAYADKLEKSIKGKNTLDELIEAFKETSKMKINGVAEEDDELLFQSDDFFGDDYNFMLTRQIPAEEGDEYIQINLTVRYEKNDETKRLSDISLFSSEVEGTCADEKTPYNYDSFFDAVKKSDNYRVLKNKTILSAEITVEET